MCTRCVWVQKFCRLLRSESRPCQNIRRFLMQPSSLLALVLCCVVEYRSASVWFPLLRFTGLHWLLYVDIHCARWGASCGSAIITHACRMRNDGSFGIRAAIHNLLLMQCLVNLHVGLLPGLQCVFLCLASVRHCCQFDQHCLPRRMHYCFFCTAGWWGLLTLLPFVSHVRVF